MLARAQSCTITRLVAMFELFNSPLLHEFVYGVATYDHLHTTINFQACCPEHWPDMLS